MGTHEEGLRYYGRLLISSSGSRYVCAQARGNRHLAGGYSSCIEVLKNRRSLYTLPTAFYLNSWVWNQCRLSKTVVTYSFSESLR